MSYEALAIRHQNAASELYARARVARDRLDADYTMEEYEVLMRDARSNYIRSTIWLSAATGIDLMDNRIFPGRGTLYD